MRSGADHNVRRRSSAKKSPTQIHTYKNYTCSGMPLRNHAISVFPREGERRATAVCLNTQTAGNVKCRVHLVGNFKFRQPTTYYVGVYIHTASNYNTTLTIPKCRGEKLRSCNWLDLFYNYNCPTIYTSRTGLFPNSLPSGANNQMGTTARDTTSHRTLKNTKATDPMPIYLLHICSIKFLICVKKRRHALSVTQQQPSPFAFEKETKTRR